jgi:hypothetical protein
MAQKGRKRVRTFFSLRFSLLRLCFSLLLPFLPPLLLEDFFDDDDGDDDLLPPLPLLFEEEEEEPPRPPESPPSSSGSRTCRATAARPLPPSPAQTCRVLFNKMSLHVFVPSLSRVN